MQANVYTKKARTSSTLLISWQSLLWLSYIWWTSARAVKECRYVRFRI